MQLSQVELINVLKNSKLLFQKHIVFLSLEIDFDLTNSPDSDEMPHHINVCI